MATFMQSLAANPSGSSGIYNTQKPPDQANELAIVNQLKDREMKDFKDKAGFMADLSLKQDRLRALFDPSQQQQNNQNQGPQISQIKDPNAMNANQKAEMDMKQQQLGLDKQKLDQQGKLGQEAADTKTAQEKLNQQKSDQIHAQKIAELQQKADEATNKMGLEHDKFVQSNADHSQHIAFLNAKAAADAARVAVQHAQVDATHAETKRKDDATIADLQRRASQSGRTSTTTSLSPDGTSKTVNTTRGDASQTVNMEGKNGKHYPVPLDKVDDWKQNHSPDSPQNSQQPANILQVNPDDGTSQDDEESSGQQ